MMITARTQRVRDFSADVRRSKKSPSVCRYLDEVAVIDAGNVRIEADILEPY